MKMNSEVTEGEKEKWQKEWAKTLGTPKTTTATTERYVDIRVKCTTNKAVKK